MKDNTFKLFLILKGLKPNLRVPIYSFIEKDYTMAKILFQGYLKDENYKEFELRQVGYFNKTKLIEKDIFITGGYEAMHQQMEDDNPTKRQCKLWENFYNKKTNDVIKELFEGEYIK